MGITWNFTIDFCKDRCLSFLECLSFVLKNIFLCSADPIEHKYSKIFVQGHFRNAIYFLLTIFLICVILFGIVLVLYFYFQIQKKIQVDINFFIFIDISEPCMSICLSVSLSLNSYCDMTKLPLKESKTELIVFSTKERNSSLLVTSINSSLQQKSHHGIS